MAIIVAASLPFFPMNPGYYRFLEFGIPSLAFVVVAISLEKKIRWNRFIQKLGDASYSLYLTHTFSVLPTIKAIQIIDQQHRLPAALVFAVLMAVAIVVSLATYSWMEMPINTALRSRVKAMRWMPERVESST